MGRSAGTIEHERYTRTHALILSLADQILLLTQPTSVLHSSDPIPTPMSHSKSFKREEYTCYVLAGNGEPAPVDDVRHELTRALSKARPTGVRAIYYSTDHTCWWFAVASGRVRCFSERYHAGYATHATITTRAREEVE
jgi:hypothetical protein